MPDLEILGWDKARAAEFEPFQAAGLVPGRISLEHNHIYRALTSAGETLAEASGRIKHLAAGRRELPAVGDWVALEPDPAGDRARISALLPRRTTFSRKAAGRSTEEQVIAANVDVVLLVFGLDKPVNARAIERYLAVASRSGATSVVVLNKADLAEDVDADLAASREVSGVTDVHAVSSTQPGGAAVIERYLAVGRTLALLSRHPGIGFVLIGTAAEAESIEQAKTTYRAGGGTASRVDAGETTA